MFKVKAKFKVKFNSVLVMHWQKRSKQQKLHDLMKTRLTQLTVIAED